MSPTPLMTDVNAFMKADRTFDDLHGDEARRRWSELGAATDQPLEQQQMAVIHELGPVRAVWDAFEWEVRCRIELVTEARRDSRAPP
jgi:hypothetical protein